MKKTTLISITSLFFFTGCTASSSLTDDQKYSVGIVGGAIQACYQKGFINQNDYNTASRAYSEILNDSKKYMPLITEGYNVALSKADSLDYNFCQTEVPNRFSNIYQYYVNNRVTFTDVLEGLNGVSEVYQNHAQQMLKATSNNMYYPPINANKKAKNKTVTSYQVDDTTYFSDGTSSRRNGNTIYHSDGSNSMISNNYVYHSDGSNTLISGNYAYNSDGSNCYLSNGTLTCN